MSRRIEYGFDIQVKNLIEFIFGDIQSWLDFHKTTSQFLYFHILILPALHFSLCPLQHKPLIPHSHIIHTLFL